MAIINYCVLNDVHFPYEGKCYHEAIKQIAKLPALRGIYLNGDIAEIESVSAHPKSPTAQKLLLDELDYLNCELDKIESQFQGVSVDYICGNHEGRMYRFIRDIAPQMWGMLKEPKLLKFDERKGFTFHDYGPTQWVKCGITNDLFLRHEPLVGGAYHAKGTAERSYVSVLYGHTHQYQHFTSKKMGPTPYVNMAMSCGWLGDIKQPCFDYRGSKDNWVNGWTRIDVDENSKEYEVRFIKV